MSSYTRWRTGPNAPLVRTIDCRPGPTRVGGIPRSLSVTASLNCRASKTQSLSGMNKPTNDQDNLETWDNRARCFFHEVTHLTYFMNTPGSGPNVEDLQIRYKGPRGVPVTTDAYRPYLAKVLRNYVRKGMGGFYTQRNGSLIRSLISIL